MWQWIKETEEKQEYYLCDNGNIIQREYGKTPNGNDIGGCWVYRDAAGNWIDWNQYRHDLFGRYNIKIQNQ
jgi:hypothetical protein